MSKKVEKPRPQPFLVLLLAWLVPGIGHAYIGRLKRGIIIFITISATFWAGIAMGGVMTVDSVKERWWFIAQMFTGAHGVLSWQMTRRTYEKVVGKGRSIRDIHIDVINERLNAEGIELKAPTETVARAYVGIAGLLNLLCIFDAVMLSFMNEPREPAVMVKSGSEKGDP